MIDGLPDADTPYTSLVGEPPPPPEDNGYLKLVQDEQKQGQQQVAVSAAVAAKRPDPQRWAKVLEVAKQTGLPTGVVDRNLDELTQSAQRQSVDYNAIQQDTPGVHQWLRDPDNATVAKHEIPLLQQVERGTKTMHTPNVFFQPLLSEQAQHAIGGAFGTGYNDLVASAYQLAAVYGKMDPAEAAAGAAQAHARAAELRKQAPNYVQEFESAMKAREGNLSKAWDTFLHSQDDAAKSGIANAFNSLKTGAATIGDFLQMVGTAAARPRGTLYSGIESLPSMLPILAGAKGGAEVGGAGGAALGGVLGGPIGAVLFGATGATAGGIGGTFAGFAPVAAGNAIVQALQEHGVDMTDPSALRAAYENPALMAELRRTATRKGLTTAAVAAIIGAFAGRGLAAAEGKSAVTKAAGAAADIGVQAGGMGAAQAAGQVAAGEKPDIASAAATTVSMLGYGLAMEGVGASQRGLFHDDPQRAAVEIVGKANDAIRAQRDAQAMAEVGQAVKDAKVTATVPSRLKSLVDMATGGDPNARVFFQTEDWDKVFGEGSGAKAADDIMGDGGKAYYEAKATGGQLSIPTSDYISKVAPTDHWDALLQHAKTTPDGYTFKEAQEYLQSLPATLKELTDEATGAKPEEEAKAADPAQALHERTREQLIAAGTPASQADVQAKAMVEAFKQMAVRSGQPLTDVIAQYAPTIDRGEEPTAEPGLNQEQEHITAAAVKYHDEDRVFQGLYHGAAWQAATEAGMPDYSDFSRQFEDKASEGFVTSHGRFLTRLEAEKFAGLEPMLDGDAESFGAISEHFNIPKETPAQEFFQRGKERQHQPQLVADDLANLEKGLRKLAKMEKGSQEGKEALEDAGTIARWGQMVRNGASREEIMADARAHDIFDDHPLADLVIDPEHGAPIFSKWMSGADILGAQRMELNQSAAVPPIALPDGMFSKAERLINEKMGGRATPAEIKKLLDNNGIKADELEWSGINRILDLHPQMERDLSPGKETGKISKEDILNFMRANRLNIQEITPEASEGDLHALQDLVGDMMEEHFVELMNNGVQERPDGTFRVSYRNEETGKKQVTSGYGTEEKAKAALWELMMSDAGLQDRLEEEARDAMDPEDFDEGVRQYEQYTLPGGENYRELLFTLPDIGGREFTEGHFGEKNVFAHTRFKDRIDAEGRKVLFLEEVQSDWHQQGRERGYENKEDEEETPKMTRAEAEEMYELNRWNNYYHSVRDGATGYITVDGEYHPVKNVTEAEALKLSPADEERRQALITRWESEHPVDGGKLPDAPFKKTWHEFVMKRMLHYAVQHGYDAIGWTKGDTQNARYGLEKHFSELSYDPESRRLYTTSISGVMSQQRVFQDNLPEFLGDAVSQRLLQQPLSDYDSSRGGPDGVKVHTLSGDDLKTGGEGMRGFYDKVLPDYVNKLGKKFGAKVEEGKVQLYDPKEMHSITDNDIPQDFDPTNNTASAHELVLNDALKAQIKNVGFELYQDGAGATRGRIRFGTSGAISISLLAKADPSTFLHETGHLYTKMLAELSAKPEASPEMVADNAALRQWAGAEDGKDLTVEQNEKIARGFEAYLMEGKAPSDALRTAFFRFKTWLTRIYGTIKSLNVDLTPEVRGVFDRLLASQDAIANAEHTGNVQPLFDDPAKVGMNDADAAKYAVAVADARQAADEQLTQKMMAELKREESAEWKAWRDPIEAETTKAVDAMPVYQASAYLEKGTASDGSALPAGTVVKKLSKAAVIGAYGPEAANGIPRGMVTKTGGVHPDVIAEMFGFDSGRALVDAIRAAPKRDDYIRQQTDARMQSEHGERMTPDELQANAQEAVRGNDKHMQLLRTEFATLAKQDPSALKGLVRAVNKRVAPDAELQTQAANIIGGKAVGDIRPYDYELAARRASKEAQEALLGGDVPAAMAAKHKEILVTATFNEANAAREAVNTALDGFKKFLTSDARLAKSRDMDLINAGRAVLAKFGIGSAPADAMTHLEQMRRYDLNVYDAVKDMVADATVGATGDYQTMSYDDFKVLQQTVESMWNLSRRTQQFEAAGVLMDRETVRQELLDRLAALASTKGAKGEYNTTMSDRQKITQRLLSAPTALRRVEHWVTAMDGGDPEGSFRKYVYDPVKNGATHYRVAFTAAMEKLADIVKGFESDISHEKIDAPELVGANGRGFQFKDKAQLLGALMHVGNGFESGSNGYKLLRGREWGQVNDETGVLNTQPWDTFIRRMEDEGVITKNDYDRIQKIWDLFNELKVGAQQSHKTMYGHYFNEVTAVPFQTKYGEYAGGYAPAIADPFETVDPAIRRDKEQLLSEHTYMFPSMPTTGRGSMLDRSAHYAAPLIMDINSVPTHLDAVLRFTHIEPPVRDVARLMTDKGFRQQLDAHDPNIAGQVLTPWLSRAAQQAIETKGTNPGMDTFWRYMRNNAVVQTLGGNVVTPILMASHFPAALARSGPTYMADALWHFVRDSKGITEMVAEKSPFMRTRSNAGIIEIQKSINKILLDPSVYTKANNFIREHSTFLMHGVQNVADHLTWMSAYDKEIHDGATDAQAIKRADSAVRETQGSFDPEDISKFEAGTPAVRAMSTFYGFFNNKMNFGQTEASIARQVGLKNGGSRLLYAYIAGFMLPSVMAGVTRRAASGQSLIDRNHPTTDALKLFFGSQLEMGARMIPVFGQVGQSMYDMFAKKGDSSDEVAAAPVIKQLEGVARTPKDLYESFHGQMKGRQIRDILTTLGMLTHLPTQILAKPMAYTRDIHQGTARPTSTFDFLRGFTTGTAGAPR